MSLENVAIPETTVSLLILPVRFPENCEADAIPDILILPADLIPTPYLFELTSPPT